MKRLATIVVFFLISCNDHNSDKKIAFEKTDLSVKKNDTSNVNEEIKLPFVGQRTFDTRPGFTGTGTPHRFVEITKNGDVFFSFEQQNQADGTLTKEKYYGGKFKRHMLCVFKKLDEEKTFYEITTDTIYEIDENNRRLKSQDCCNPDESADNMECDCKGVLLR